MSQVKRIAYVSTLNSVASNAKFSSELMKILNTAREFNAKQGISGVLLTSGNTVFQLLEGDTSALAPLVYRIGRDPRHKNFSMVLNERAEARLFPNWSMRLLVKGSLMHEQVVRKIQGEVGSRFNPQSLLDKERLGEILMAPKKAEKPLAKPSAVGVYDQQVLSMSGWPRPNQMRITGEIVDLCSNLVGKQREYAELKSVSRCKTDEQLLSCLTAVDNIGLLQKQAKLVAVDGGMSQARTPSRDRFSSVLRKFISSTRN